jgi:hypothetical protein
MKRALAAFSLACAFSSPALATGEISCSNGKGADIDLLVGHVDVLSIARAVVTIGEKIWSSTPDSVPGQPISVGQAFADDQQLMVDITDDGVTEILGRLRVFKLNEGDKSAMAGVFSFKGEGAFAVDCSEPE